MVLPELIETLRAAYDRGSVNDFWYAWNMETESNLYQAFCGAGGPLPLVVMPVGVGCVLVDVHLMVGLLAAVVLVGYVRFVMVMRWMLRLLSSFSTLLVLLYLFFVGRLSLLLKLSRTFGIKGFFLFFGIREWSAVTASVDRCAPWSLGLIGFP